MIEEWENSSTTLIKEGLEQIDWSLVDLKLVYLGQIEWGKLYGRLSKDGFVMEFA